MYHSLKIVLFPWILVYLGELRGGGDIYTDTLKLQSNNWRFTEFECIACAQAQWLVTYLEHNIEIIVLTRLSTMDVVISIKLTSFKSNPCFTIITILLLNWQETVNRQCCQVLGKWMFSCQTVIPFIVTVPWDEKHDWYLSNDGKVFWFNCPHCGWIQIVKQFSSIALTSSLCLMLSWIVPSRGRVCKQFSISHWWLFPPINRI